MITNQQKYIFSESAAQTFYKWSIVHFFGVSRTVLLTRTKKHTQFSTSRVVLYRRFDRALPPHSTELNRHLLAVSRLFRQMQNPGVPLPNSSFGGGLLMTILHLLELDLVVIFCTPKYRTRRFEKSFLIYCLKRFR